MHGRLEETKAHRPEENTELNMKDKIQWWQVPFPIIEYKNEETLMS